MRTRDFETKSSVFRFQSLYVKEDSKQKAGFWGYLMQITFQVKFPPENYDENWFYILSPTIILIFKLN